MVYVAEGMLLVRQKPETYMNMYVYSSRSQGFPSQLESTLDDGEPSAHDRWMGFNLQTVRSSMPQILATNSQAEADSYTQRGLIHEWIDDLKKADEFCLQYPTHFEESRRLIPKEGWEAYLTSKYSDFADSRTVRGNLHLWSVRRFPTPWMHFFSKGSLVGTYAFDGSKFVLEQNSNVRRATRTTFFGSQKIVTV